MPNGHPSEEIGLLHEDIAALRRRIEELEAEVREMRGCVERNHRIAEQWEADCHAERARRYDAEAEVRALREAAAGVTACYPTTIAHFRAHPDNPQTTGMRLIALADALDAARRTG